MSDIKENIEDKNIYDFDVDIAVNTIDIQNLKQCKKRCRWASCSYNYTIKLSFKNGKKQYIDLPSCSSYYRAVISGYTDHDNHSCTECKVVDRKWNLLYKIIRQKMKDVATITSDVISKSDVYSDTSSEGYL